MFSTKGTEEEKSETARHCTGVERFKIQQNATCAET